MRDAETVWAQDADEARYERDRVEAEEPWLLDEPEPEFGWDEPVREPPFPDPMA